jgi:hypothetical protein
MEYDLYRKLSELEKKETSWEKVAREMPDKKELTHGDWMDVHGIWDNPDKAFNLGCEDGQIELARLMMASYHRENGGK